MKRLILVRGCCFVLLGCANINADEPDKKPTGAEARAAADKWLAGLGEKGLVLSEHKNENGFVVTYGPSAVGRITKFSFRQPGWWASFVFRGEITADTSLETLRKQFWRVSLDRLPTPGLKLPGWEVRPQTPVSSFTKGVEILAYGDGKIRLRVRTQFFALYGRDPAVLVPADAASPPGSYFQIRKTFPLDLTIDAPFEFPAKPEHAAKNANTDWQVLGAKQRWYTSQQGKEMLFRGTLAAVPNADGPSTLQRTSYYRLGNRTIYTGAKRLPVLDRLVGKRVEIRGKAVDFELEGQALRELWPAAVRVAVAAVGATEKSESRLPDGNRGNAAADPDDKGIE